MSDFKIGGPSCPLVANAYSARNRLKKLGLYDDVVDTMMVAANGRLVCSISCSERCLSVDQSDTVDLGVTDVTLANLANSFGEISKLGKSCTYVGRVEEEVA